MRVRGWFETRGSARTEVANKEAQGREPMSREGRLIKEIRAAVKEGRLKEPFAPRDLIQAEVRCAANTRSRFLWKHRVGNGSTTEHFVHVARGQYRLA